MSAVGFGAALGVGVRSADQRGNGDKRQYACFLTTLSWKSHISCLLSLLGSDCHVVPCTTGLGNAVGSHFSASSSFGFCSRHKRSLTELTLFRQPSLDRKMSGN